MYLLIDDVRNFHCDIIARTAEAGKKILEQLHNDISCLGIDHDLGELENGYNIITWALERNILPKQVQIVTMNPVGRKAMESLLIKQGYVHSEGTFVKGK